MTEQPFKEFAAAVARSLQTHCRSRDEIACELVDHLEERFQELVDQGNPCEEAVRLAVSELGDAKVLASEFDSISRNTRRRWIMRFTTAAIASSFVIAVMLMSMWPEQSSLPMAGTTQAQETSGANTTDVRGRSPSVEENNEATRAKLNTFIDGRVSEMSLGDIPLFFSQQVDVPIHLKRFEIEAEGISPDEQISLNVKADIRALFALELMLDDVGLDYAIRDGIVIITTDADVEYFHEIRVYNCRNLLQQLGPDSKTGRGRGHSSANGYGGGGYDEDEYGEDYGGLGGGSSLGGYGDEEGYGDEDYEAAEYEDEEFDGDEGIGYGGGGMMMSSRTARYADTDSLIEIITSTISPDSWTEVGGPGTVSAYNGIIVVSNNAQVHNKIDDLLEMLQNSIRR